MHKENVEGRNSKKRLLVVNSGCQDSAGQLINRILPAFRQDKVSPISQAGAATGAEETSSPGAKPVSWLFQSEVRRQHRGAKGRYLLVVINWSETSAQFLCGVIVHLNGMLCNGSRAHTNTGAVTGEVVGLNFERLQAPGTQTETKPWAVFPTRL
jgi:hypothetical protein